MEHTTYSRVSTNATPNPSALPSLSISPTALNCAIPNRTAAQAAAHGAAATLPPTPIAAPPLAPLQAEPRATAAASPRAPSTPQLTTARPQERRRRGLARRGRRRAAGGGQEEEAQRRQAPKPHSTAKQRARHAEHRRDPGCPPARFLPRTHLDVRLRRSRFASTQLKSSERASMRAVEGGQPVRDHLAAPHRVVQRPGRTQATAKCAARDAQRRRRPLRPKGPRWHSPERSISSTSLTHSRTHDRPDLAPHQPQRGYQRWLAQRGRIRGHAWMQIGLHTKGRQTRVSTPHKRTTNAPRNAPSA